MNFLISNHLILEFLNFQEVTDFVNSLFSVFLELSEFFDKLMLFFFWSLFPLSAVSFLPQIIFNNRKISSAKKDAATIGAMRLSFYSKFIFKNQ